jgi:hypothetical protein
VSNSRSVLKILPALCALSCLVPATAGAYATVAPPPKQSGSSGLPDGRVYELVSEFNKHGYQAGIGPRHLSNILALFSVSSPDGNTVAYRSTGPAAGTDASGLSFDFVADRTAHGWTSRSTTARGLGQSELFSFFSQFPEWVNYSPTLSHLAYAVESADVPDAPRHGIANIYLMGASPLAEPTWLLRSAASPLLEGHTPLYGMALLGMTPDASVVYFGYGEPLLPQDASRAGWGLYESRRGVVSEVGVLPDGSVPVAGAYPAATATAPGQSIGGSDPASHDNQVSEDGRRLFYVSSGQLYVHKLEADGSENSVLVSASQLPGHVGEAAPDGVSLFENLTRGYGGGGTEFSTQKNPPTYVYASADGSHAFFQTMDQLTSDAPNDSTAKVYDFDVDTGSLEYLPEVALGGIVTAAKDGSSFIFVNDGSAPPELDRWTANASRGSVAQIIQLPAGGFVGPGRSVADGSVIVFQAQGPLPGVDKSADEQIYRYDVNSSELNCVSCPPGGTAQSGNTYLSAIDNYMTTQSVNDVRGVSSDGKRIFFGSPNPLVSRDTNGDFDTYEWEDGTVYLISSGIGSDYSPFLDNSESGGDVFFATTDELVEGDNDGGFDVYDARIPRPGDNPPPSAVPCAGDVCQGAPSVPQLLGAPPSATFNGVGNVFEEPPSSSKSKSKPRALSTARRLANALSACRKRQSKAKRAICERQAHRRFSAARASIKRNQGRGK